MKASHVALAASVAVLVSFGFGCGGNSGPGNPPPVAPHILSQPQDQSTPLSHGCDVQSNRLRNLAAKFPMEQGWCSDPGGNQRLVYDTRCDGCRQRFDL